MNIDTITNGYVLDHITAGKGMSVYNYLGLDELDCSVAIIRNVKSQKMGKKDIIKIDALIDIDLDVLGYIDSGITVNIVKNSVIERKEQLRLPTTLQNVIKCKNPRCITSAEGDLNHIFYLADEEKHLYRCRYCDSPAKQMHK